MKPGSPQAKALYSKKEIEFKGELEKSKAYIRRLEAEINENSDSFRYYRQISIANEYLRMINLYINITDDMSFLKGAKNESYLNEARKTYFNILLTLEKIYTDIINLEPTEIQEVVEKIPKFDPARKLIFFRKITRGFYL